MINFFAKKRTSQEKSENIRREGQIPANLYGPEIKNLLLKLEAKDFSKIFEETGYSSLISLEIEGKKIPVLIHEVQQDPLTGGFLHVDFYSPKLKEKIEAKIPLVFEGEAPAVKEGGTLVKNMQEVEVKALPQNLPKEIRINIGELKTLEDSISVKDLKLPPEVEILKEAEAIVAHVAAPEKVEEELEKPIEEKVEEVEKVEKKKEKEEENGEKEDSSREKEEKEK
jgi:large subunit ribosomal protein L25